MIRFKTLLGITLVLLVGQFAWGELRVKSTQQQNDDAAKKVERKFRQYKRVHQEILKLIVAGNEDQALKELDTIIRVVPRDGESHYMRAVCNARLSRVEKAIADVKRALELGIEPSRFRGGTKTGLASSRADMTPLFNVETLLGTFDV